MAHPNARRFVTDSPAGVEARPSADDLIRPALNRAFPLLTEELLDEKFHALLQALAERTGGTR